MPSPNDLLTTLSQSSAVMVAIIGGFLVSRLVALSSEREGIRRQLRESRERLDLFHADYAPAHEHRLGWSQEYFDDLVLDKLIENPQQDIEELIADNVPRGSSIDEIRPYAEELQHRVRAGFEAVDQFLRDSDGPDTDLGDLRARGLQIADRDIEIVESVLYSLVSTRRSSSMYAAFAMPPIQSAAQREIEARRFDEAVKEEADLLFGLRSTEQEVDRLGKELTRLAKPTGVVSAVWMLAVLSVTGIVVPVLVMATDPVSLAAWLKIMLIGLFVVGIASVLAYVIWYLRAINESD